jgi:hypothetical protein
MSGSTAQAVLKKEENKSAAKERGDGSSSLKQEATIRIRYK